MSLPPERISIKRRRQEEPVDTLVLERGIPRDQKRRLTEVYFQRLPNDTINLAPPVPPVPGSQFPVPNTQPQRRASDQNGIPTVRSTEPGDEIKDIVRLRAIQKARKDGEKLPSTAAQAPEIKTADTRTISKSASSSPRLANSLKNARRFHLSHDLSSVLGPDPSGRVRKQRSFIRPPLATFTERIVPVFNDKNNSIHKRPPVDRVVNHQEKIVNGPIAIARPSTPDLETLTSSERSSIKTFHKPESPLARRGQSIKDHPSTWDHDSDQLADELAALAMELDPSPQNSQSTPVRLQAHPVSTNTMSRDVDMLESNDFVYETYIRIQPDSGLIPIDLTDDSSARLGILVINEEDEELWQRYAEDEEDSDWDEEDSNAEDNPANDYPEEEISSDDEFGHNVYKHRQLGSDDEQYDDDPEW